MEVAVGSRSTIRGSQSRAFRGRGRTIADPPLQPDVPATRTRRRSAKVMEDGPQLTGDPELDAVLIETWKEGRTPGVVDAERAEAEDRDTARAIKASLEDQNHEADAELLRKEIDDPAILFGILSELPGVNLADKRFDRLLRE